MSDKTTNYEDYTLDPSGDVLVPTQTFMALNNIVQAIEVEHSKVMETDKYAFFRKGTNKKLSKKSEAKLKSENPEKLLKEYYENLDLDATAKTRRVDRDKLGTAAIRLLGELRGVFRYNVDKDNCILRSELENSNVEGPAPISKANES